MAATLPHARRDGSLAAAWSATADVASPLPLWVWTRSVHADRVRGLALSSAKKTLRRTLALGQQRCCPTSLAACRLLPFTQPSPTTRGEGFSASRGVRLS